MTIPGSVSNVAPETVTLGQAKKLINALGDRESLLMLSPPGLGKSDIVYQAAADAGLECRSLLGTQIAPEDVSGVPRIVGERSVFCPPRVLLPEEKEPFCLFLDELPACMPDVQKSFYSLLLERRIGEFPLPAGTWVVGAGNRLQDRALVRSLSSALINRVTMLHLRVDVSEWRVWAKCNKIRSDIRAFVTFMPEALLRPVPTEPIPFSTPRAWSQLSRALDRVEQLGFLTKEIRRALAFGKVSPEDAAIYCAMTDESLIEMKSISWYIQHPKQLPTSETSRWFVLSRIRRMAEAGELKELPARTINNFIASVSEEQRLALLVDLVPVWAELGAEPAMYDTLKKVVGL